MQTIFVWQTLAGACFLLFFADDFSGFGDPLAWVLGPIVPGTLGAAPAICLLLLADASDRRVTWGWPVWEAEPWRGAVWQTGKVFAVLLPLAAAGWGLAAALRVFGDA
ncbi:hypothetical protein [Alienimonas sp. DA493]|uniref:hypothetical protein n=1 Tax=Alienimonas sp. DA493 TaxID=3373605 RepID=UPI0037543AD0